MSEPISARFGSTADATILSLTRPEAAEIGDREAIGRGAVKVVLAVFTLIGVIVVLNHAVDRL